MDYVKIYAELIEKARKENRKKLRKSDKNYVYYEGHHIIPDCMGGEGKTTQWSWHPNIVLLTYKEHYMAHHLLAVIFPEEWLLQMAYSALCMKPKGYFGKWVPSPRAMENASIVKGLDRKKYCCEDCGTDEPEKFRVDRKTLCEECKNKRRRKNDYEKGEKPYLCVDCGETEPDKMVKGRKGMCKKCKNKRRAKPKPIKPHLCQDCGETNPEDFYEGHKSRCKGCVVKIVCENQKKKKELEPV